MTNPDKAKQLRIQTIEAVEKYTDLGNKLFGTNMVSPIATFRLTGTCGGMYSSRGHEVKVNMVLLEENESHYLSTTVPHEVAHALQRHIYGSYHLGRRVMPHGRQWKSIMIRLGLDPKRCHTYDTSNSAKSKVGKNFEYRCSCKTFMFTIIRHRRAKAGRGYRCPKCKERLQYAGANASQVVRPIYA
jgi:SprT protein